MAAPLIEPWVKVPPFCDNLADTVEHAQGVDPSILEYTDYSPTSSSHGASRAPNTFRFTPPAAATTIPLP